MSDVPRLDTISASASARIRRFLADSTVKGGASPADVADLYTAPEIMADTDATAYLDRRFVHGDMPSDWRRVQDDLNAARYDAPPGLTGEALLARSVIGEAGWQPARSMFDDPEELDEAVENRGAVLLDRDPTLEDLTPDGRRAIERLLVAEVLGFGIAPIKIMELRELLDASDDARGLQYLDLPTDRGERPADWDSLRDRAARLRGRLSAAGHDPGDLFARTEADHPYLNAADVLDLLGDTLER